MPPSKVQIPEHLLNPFVALKWSWRRQGQASLRAVREDGTRRVFVATNEDEKKLLAKVAAGIEKQILALEQLENESRHNP